MNFIKLARPLFFRKIITSVLVFTFISGNVVYAAPNDDQKDEKSELAGEQKAFADVESELLNSSETTEVGPSKDEFGITRQYLVYKGVRYPITAFNLPTVVPGDFEKDVTITSDISSDGMLIFSYTKKGKVIARHEIEGYGAVTGARDQELYTFRDRSGNDYSIDMAYAKDYAFRGPLPIFKLEGKNINFDREITATYKTRGLRRMPFAENAIYPEDIPLGDLNDAGDFVLYGPNSAGQNEIVVQLNRNIIRTIVANGEAVLGMNAFLESPSLDSKALAPQLLEFQKSEEVRRATEANLKQIDPLEAAVLTNLPKGTIANLVKQAQINKNSSNIFRDKFTDVEWEESFAKLEAQANIELKNGSKIPNLEANLNSGDLGENWQALTEASMAKKTQNSLLKVLTSRSMKIMAILVAEGTAVFGVDHALYGGRGAAWALHITNQLYDKYWPPVLRDQVYRKTLLRSSIALGSFVPMMYVLGMVSSKLNGNWGAVKTLAAEGMRISSVISLPFFHYVADLARQPNFIRALQRGINPLKGVQTDEGTVYPAFNKFTKGEAFNNQVAKNARLLEAEASRKAKLKSIAWGFATMVVGEESGFDPATLTLLAEQGGVTGNILEKLTADPQFKALWIQSAQEIEYVFLHMGSKMGAKDIHDMDPADFARALSIARSTVARVQNRKGYERLLVDLKMKWRDLTASVVPGFASFGVQESEFLKNAEPSKFVFTQFWKQFVVDYLLAVGQIGLFGARADLSHPENLAASANHFLSTNPGHRADMVDQVRIYGIGVPASMALVYQKNASPVESRYNPVEEILLKGEIKPEGYFTGLWNWAKAASNLAEADYAGIYQKSFIKSVKTIQASILMSLVGRMLLGGQHFHDAAPAFLYVMMSGVWRYAWPWAIINRGNQVNQERAEKNQVVLTDAKVRLGQSLRVGDTNRAAQGYVDLAALYENASTDLPVEIEAMIPQVKAFLENPNLEVIDSARAQFEQNLQTHGASLLDVAMKTPPFAVKPHPLAEWTTTLIGALSTTYLAVSLSVESFQTNVDWPHRLVHTALLTAAFYAGTYYGQKAFVGISNAVKESKEGTHDRTLLGVASSRFQVCGDYLAGLLRRPVGQSTVK